MMAKDVTNELGKVVVLMGGNTPHRELSLESGASILKALLQKGIDAHGLDVQEDIVSQLQVLKPDRAFIALHGPKGSEDGSIQGMLESLNIPYTGSGVIGSALASNKILTKYVWQSAGILTPPFRIANTLEAAIGIMEEFGLPLCIKPTNNGSMAASTKVVVPEQLPEAFERAAVYNTNNSVLIETWIQGTEFVVNIVRDLALPVIEIVDTGPGIEPNYLCPPSLSLEKEIELQKMAFMAFSVLGGRGWGRIDAMSDWQDNFWFLQATTIPTMTENGLFSKAAQIVDFSIADLVMEILTDTL